jgi:hypothetical protein
MHSNSKGIMRATYIEAKPTLCLHYPLPVLPPAPLPLLPMYVPLQVHSSVANSWLPAMSFNSP